MDEHCKLDNGEVFEDYDCSLKLLDEKSETLCFVIQLLKVARTEEFYIWTRSGKNGSTEDSKLEGPMSLENAEKCFKNKFMEKTGNSWDNRSRFVPVDGQYRLDQTTTAISRKLGNPEVDLPKDLFCAILVHLHTQDVLKCMQVCKSWKAMLSEKYFWTLLIQRRFDLKLKTDLSDEGNLGIWSQPDPWTEIESEAGEWFCYYDDLKDPYVIRPFPSVWNCGVAHPFGLDPMSGDLKSLQGLSRSLEILTRIRKAISDFDLQCGNECSSNESSDAISVVLFRWEEYKLPTPVDILTKIFHFHPEICEYYVTTHPEDKGELRDKELYFHIPNPSPDSDDSDKSEDHDVENNPCLNSIFGTFGFEDDEEWKFEELKKFFQWLQRIMVPSLQLYLGSEKLNPILIFLITQLAPGWVGGALTGSTWT